MSKKDEAVLFYEGKYYALSNFAPFTLVWKGKLYPTSEQAYQAERFVDEEVKEYIRTAPSTHEAYRYAQEHKNRTRPGWSEDKLLVMESILREKVAQHDYVKTLLLETGDRDLIKNFEGDAFWGSGESNLGDNMLGKLWMKIRKELKTKESLEK
jgi:ribA/ribD-fused uncharacterized protein